MNYKSVRNGIALCVLIVLSIAAGYRYGVDATYRSIRTSRQASANWGQTNDMVLSEFNSENLQINSAQVMSGGPGKDGIPALVNPTVVALQDAAFLKDDDRLLVVSHEGQTRGYPVSILNWHEIVNDTLAEVPIAVIYCPLCDSFSVVDRRMGEDTLEFGVSGLLMNSNVLMYDRTNNALWSQLGLEAISGPHAGKSLTSLPWQIMTAKQIKAAYPQSQVMSINTEHGRNYDANPYDGYFSNDELMFPVEHVDERLPTKTRIIGVRVGELTRAYPVAAITQSKDGRLTDTLGDAKIVLISDPANGVGVSEHPPEAQIVHTFWYAWAAFHPETSLYEKR